MIMPSKYIKEHEALIGIGAMLLQYINTNNTVSSLWEQVKDMDVIGSFGRFILALDLLFLLGLVNVDRNNSIIRTTL